MLTTKWLVILVRSRLGLKPIVQKLNNSHVLVILYVQKEFSAAYNVAMVSPLNLIAVALSLGLAILVRRDTTKFEEALFNAKLVFLCS